MTTTTEEEYAHLGETPGCPDHDYDLVQEFSRRLSGLWRMDQFIANAEGRFKEAKRDRDALEIFKLNIEEYPESANLYDSYGDGLLAKGDTLAGLEQFRLALSMDSTMTETLEKIAELEGVGQ